MNKPNNMYALDKTIKGVSCKNDLQYIAKSYKTNGKIIYFENDEEEDGFSNIIDDLNNGAPTVIFANTDKIISLFDFLGELKHSVSKGTLKIIFSKEKEVKYYF